MVSMSTAEPVGTAVNASKLIYYSEVVLQSNFRGSFKIKITVDVAYHFESIDQNPFALYSLLCPASENSTFPIRPRCRPFIYSNQLTISSTLVGVSLFKIDLEYYTLKECSNHINVLVRF